MFVAVPALVVALKGPETTIRLAYAVFRHENFTEWLLYLLWILGMVGLLGIVHETIHALCSRWFGFRVKFGIEYSNLVNLTPTTLTYGGFQSRRQSLAIVLAPLVVLTPISIIVLVVSTGFWVQASAVFIVLGNTVGSMADLGKAWMIVKLPAGELTFHDREGRQQYYTAANE